VLLHIAVTGGWLPAYLAAALAVGALAWWSRGLHLDGLADTADGLAAAYDRERALDVMRRSDIGPTGVVTLVLVLLVQVTALGPLLDVRFGLVVAAVVASRQVLALACRRSVPAARPEGLGATVAGSVSTPAALVGTVVMVVIGAGIGLLGGARWYAGALVVVASALAAATVVTTARRRLGGITGDVLGAVVELALATGLVAGIALSAVS
jgi:adenosylcobinamide-GDP ribazoletransferase